jgi:hypothetical protein
MRSKSGLILALFGKAILLATASGCLSLGLGGTTYTGSSPEVEGRVSSLESRVGKLESMLNGPPTPSMAPSATPGF